MKRRTLLGGTAALALARPAASRAQSAAPASAGNKTRIVFWHAMNGALNDEVNRLCTLFNSSQGTYEVQPVFKGTYPETLTAAIAAFRAGQAPHIAQIFEVGTGSMLAAGRAVKQFWELAKETGVNLDPNAYIPAVRSYYSLPDGRMASAPFNSSTAVMWYNKDAFEKAGLDPEKPPATWDDVARAAQALKAKQATPSPVGSSWFSWIQLEQFSAIHDIPFASKANGFEGLDAVLEINTPPHVKQIQRVLDMAKDGLFKYGGRDNAPDPLFYSGQVAINFTSSAGRADIAKNAQFRWAAAYLPYDPAIIKEPINSIIGGASLWTMTAPGRTEAEYKGAAEFYAFLATPENSAAWHQHTGYVPITTAGYELSKQQGYYEKTPGTEIAVKQLLRGHVTPNSRGVRLGRLLEIRNIIYEEVERALQGQQDAKAAMDNATQRGNRVLREFERSVKT